MINMETVQFIMMIDSLCELSSNGIKPLSDIKNTLTVEDCVYFDDSASVYNAITGETHYRAVSVLWEEENYNEEDNIFWDEYIDTNTHYSVTVITSDNEEPYVQVKCGDQTFILQDGECRSA